MAFKAIYLPEGNSKVSFTYNDIRQSLAVGWLIIVGTTLAALGLGYLLWRIATDDHNNQQQNIPYVISLKKN